MVKHTFYRLKEKQIVISNNGVCTENKIGIEAGKMLHKRYTNQRVTS